MSVLFSFLVVLFHSGAFGRVDYSCRGSCLSKQGSPRLQRHWASCISSLATLRDGQVCGFVFLPCIELYIDPWIHVRMGVERGMYPGRRKTQLATFHSATPPYTNGLLHLGRITPNEICRVRGAASLWFTCAGPGSPRACPRPQLQYQQWRA